MVVYKRDGIGRKDMRGGEWDEEVNRPPSRLPWAPSVEGVYVMGR